MDMLGNPSFRRILTEYYQESKEPKLVRYAIKVARWREYSQSNSSMDSIGSAVSFAVFGAKKVSPWDVMVGSISGLSSRGTVLYDQR